MYQLKVDVDKLNAVKVVVTGTSIPLKTHSLLNGSFHDCGHMHEAQ